MSEMQNIAEKLNKSLSRLQPTLIDSIEELERENRIYREEIMRLQGIVSGLIKILGDKVFIKSIKSKRAETQTTPPKG